MDKNKTLDGRSFLDLLFEGRNKDYGAYELRKNYSKRLTIALIATILTIGVVTSAALAYQKIKPTAKKVEAKKVMLEDIKMPEEQVAPPPPPPPPPPKEVPQQAKSQYTPPKLVDEVKEPPKEVKDMKDTKIDNQNAEGIKTSVTTPPPAAPAAAPAPSNTPLDKVDVIAKYPGNWMAFLQKTIQYPEDAQEQGVQGSVNVKFVVDTDGNVSDVHATSGPPSLRAEAERAIRKSGKWIPAEKDGQKAKAYRNQSIQFVLQESE